VRVEPVTLDGTHVRLEPVGAHHVDGLWHAGRYPELWRMRPFPVHSRDDLAAQVDAALASATAATLFMFATVERTSGRPIGSTCFLNLDPPNRHLEIGGTWITPAWQRTVANTEAKYLQLRHCFDTLGCLRVEFKTDLRNARSRAALTRLGAVEEGTLRHHVVLPDGYRRDSVYFSILDREWPAVRVRLEDRMRTPALVAPPTDW
jgi:RimJ/RimL family protein N-acetyltransferase